MPGRHGAAKAKNMVQLLVLDLDGTALGGYEPYDRFPDRLSAFLDRVSENGVLWATCTTWHPRAQEEVFMKSMLKSRPVRLVGGTGMYMGLYSGGKLFLDAEWDWEATKMKVEYAVNYAPEIRDYLDDSGLAESYEEDGFDYIFSVKLKSSAAEFRAAAGESELLKEYTNILFSSDTGACQIFPYYMSKGMALKKLQPRLNISAENTMVAGDGTNDLSMMEKSLARYQVAPANADAQVKEAVLKNGGIVSDMLFSDGVVDAAGKVLETDRWP